MNDFVEPNHIKPLVNDILKGKKTQYEVIHEINQITDKETFEYYFEDFKEAFNDVAVKFFFSIKEEYNLTFIVEDMIEDVEFHYNENINISDLIFIKKLINEDKEMEEIAPIDIFNKIEKVSPYFMAYKLEIKEIGNTYHLYKIFKILKNKLTPLKDTYYLEDLNDTTATEKIIFLHKLGIIDFLRTKQPFTSSINSLATIFSAITGAKSGTIQSMLNAMLSKDTDQKNNPLKSQKPVKKVNQQLINIGFNLDKTI